MARVLALRTFTMCAPPPASLGGAGAPAEPAEPAEAAATLKFNVRPRVVLSNADLARVYGDATVSKRLAHVLFEATEDDLRSLRNAQGRIAVGSETWELYVMATWEDVSALRDTLGTGYISWGKQALIVGRTGKRVVDTAITTLLVVPPLSATAA